MFLHIALISFIAAIWFAGTEYWGFCMLVGGIAFLTHKTTDY